MGRKCEIIGSKLQNTRKAKMLQQKEEEEDCKDRAKEEGGCGAMHSDVLTRVNIFPILNRIKL